jgi:hypothetical protein
MNTRDLSERRNNSRRGGSRNGDGHNRNFEEEEPNYNTDATYDNHERFNLNQYYNAVEDEQIYMDEYTLLIHRYNDFIMNGNALFSRMEQTLRSNIARAVTRQSYFYHQSNELHRRVPQAQRQPAHTIQEPATVVPEIPSVGMPVSTSATASAGSSAIRFGDVFPRLLSRYVNTELGRETREPMNTNTNTNTNTNNMNMNNLFSMLYSIPVESRVNATANTNTNGAAFRSAHNAPTNEQINRATMNTVFSHILSPVNSICPISRDEFNDESQITMIRGCNHIFNRDSLREWFVNHSTCPLCRNDIRDYRPPSLQEPVNVAPAPAPAPAPATPTATVSSGNVPTNFSIDRIDGEHVTFSYDLPLNYNNNADIYRNIINTVNWMTNSVGNRNHASEHSNDREEPEGSPDDNNNNNHADDDIVDID